jgi:membrane protein
MAKPHVPASAAADRKGYLARLAARVRTSTAYRVARSYARELFARIREDDVSGLSAELAYRVFLSFFPFSVFLVALGGWIADAMGVTNPAPRVVDFVRPFAPPDVANILAGQVDRIIHSHSSAILSLGAVSALFFATGAMNAVIKATNRAFDVEEGRPFWARYLMALLLTVLAACASVVSIAVLALGQLAGSEVASRIGIAELAGLLGLTRWPLSALLLIGAVTTVYRLAPNSREPLRFIVPGAVLFVIGWLLASLLFSLYLANWASYDATYGTLAGIAILLIWLYASSMALVLGAEFNASLKSPRHREATPDPPA